MDMIADRLRGLVEVMKTDLSGASQQRSLVSSNLKSGDGPKQGIYGGMAS
jgi:hypothetical protein